MKEEDNTAVTMIVGVILVGGIGAFFGGIPGFIVGGIIGAFLGVRAAEEEKKKSQKVNDSATSASSDKATGQAESGNFSAKATQSTQQSDEAGFIDQTQYADAIIALIAGCMVADGKVEKAELKMATSLIKNDDLLTDKKSVIEKAQARIRELFASRKESKAVFNLKISADLNRLSSIKDPALKERLLLVLEGMTEALSGADSPDTEEFGARVKAKLSQESAANTKQEAAENFILNSGDKEAIEALRQMRANPGGYQQALRNGARENTVLKTALGVFTGFIAADLVTSAIHQHQLQQALEAFEAELAGMGGLDELDLGDNSYSGFSYEVEDAGFESGCGPEELDVASAEPDEIGGDFDSEDFDLFS